MSTKVFLLFSALIVLILTVIIFAVVHKGSRKDESNDCRDCDTQIDKDITLDLMYINDTLFCDQTKNLNCYNDVSDFDYSELQAGDIIRVHGDFKIIFATEHAYIEKIDSCENVTDEYYRDNDFKALEIVDDYCYDLYHLVSNCDWHYLHNITKDKYISIEYNYPNGYIVIENGELLGFYKEKKSIYYDGMTHFYLAQYDISEEDALEMLETNNYQNIYYVGKSDS